MKEGNYQGKKYYSTDDNRKFTMKPADNSEGKFRTGQEYSPGNRRFQQRTEAGPAAGEQREDSIYSSDREMPRRIQSRRTPGESAASGTSENTASLRETERGRADHDKTARFPSGNVKRPQKVLANRTSVKREKRIRHFLIIAIVVALMVLFMMVISLAVYQMSGSRDASDAPDLLSTYEKGDDGMHSNDEEELQGSADEDTEEESKQDPTDPSGENFTAEGEESDYIVPDEETAEAEKAGSEEQMETDGMSDPQAGYSQTAQSEYEMVINRTYPIPAGFIAGTGQLAVVEGSIKMESRAAEAAREMISALRRAGLSVMAVSGYRSDEKQESLYQNQIMKQSGNLYRAGTISAVPYTSEHQAGIAVDLSTDGSLSQNFANTSTGKWLSQHCAEYGFIIRYTKDKERMTGVIFEPWHFRYVGSAQVAQSIAGSGLTMEEYYGRQLAEEDIAPYLPYLKSSS